MMPSWAKRTLAFDTEASGTGENARIIEFGAVVWEDGLKVVGLAWLINPGELNMDDPEVRGAFEVNRINPEVLKDEPTFAEVFEEIKHVLEQSNVRVAHNARFDQGLLRREFARAVQSGLLKPEDAKRGSNTTLCTMALDYHLRPEPKGHSLAAVAERWGVPPWQSHRATCDAEAAARILHAMAPKLPIRLEDVVVAQKAAQAELEKIFAERYGKKNNGRE